ncbi:MAG: tRNA (adenosine(37)-N6)-dimethylallyltransferase MiaA [Xanthomonadales bacterium]|nr:tRNA (adenosine(37)-N6)-dimethylallyltransferase MiaA [Xanthomonadales bacterium]
MSADKRRAVCIMGPTASGKTGLAVELVQRYPLEIVSVDSALVYRGMDIGTAKPGPETLDRAPHRLIDLIDPSESYSAARFCEDAQRAMGEIWESGRVPLLAGGTMLYFRALLEGLSELPEADEQVRRNIEARAGQVGWAALHAELAQVDPEAAVRINPNDPQRIQRALDVYQFTGRPLSRLQGIRRQDGPSFGVLKLVICPEPRAELHRRINQRFDQMVREGLLEEVRRLRARHDLHPELPSMRAVGYRQAWAFLDGRLGEAEWVERAKAATRQLAKRQLTWLRRENGALWYDPTREDSLEKAMAAVGEFLEAQP